MSSWFSKPINIVITVVAGLMAIAAIVLIVWGVTHHTEAGLLRVCWSGGTARYAGGVEGVADGACERPEELAWPQDQIPLSVAPVEASGEPTTPDDTRVRVLASAIADINAQVGFELLRLDPGAQDIADGRVHFGGAIWPRRGEDAPGDHPADGADQAIPAGYVVHRRLGPVLRGDVYIRSDVESVDRSLYLVCVHELLHFVGLAHDDFEASVMFPLTRDDSASDVMSAARITDFDVNLLRSRYYR